MTRAPIWITGCGAVTAAGPTAQHLGDAIEAGRPLFRARDDLGGLPAASIEASPDCAAGRRLERRLDRSATLFIAAAEEAWRDAALDSEALQPHRVALLEGSSLGPLAETLRAHRALIESGHTARARPLDILRFMPGGGGASFAHAHGIRGAVLQISAGSVSSACAIGETCEKIAAGTVDVAVAGGSECPLDRSIVDRFVAAGVVSRAGSGVSPCRPFDRARDGTVLGEGAGVLILESEAHAVRRGARARAVINGYGLVTEGHSLATPDPSGVGVQEAARQALDGTGAWPDWIKAHGTATRHGDAAEYHGLVAVFGDGLTDIPVTGFKPIVGHCLGASGAVEAVAAILALERGIIPATVGTTDIDPEFPLCTLVRERQTCDARSVLLLAESFGGRCAALLLGRIEPGS